MAATFISSGHARSARKDLQVPIVCPSCTLVHRVTPSALTASTIECPSCGHTRDTKAILANLPTVLLPRELERTAA